MTAAAETACQLGHTAPDNKGKGSRNTGRREDALLAPSVVTFDDPPEHLGHVTEA